MTDEAPSTSSEYIAFVIAPICTASLSILGSGTLIFKILRDLAKNGCTTPYDRFIFGLSVGDILFSFSFAIRPFLEPRGRHAWAFGNGTTCQAFSFLTVLSTSAWWYNGLLSYFFLLTVLSQVRQKNYLQQFEPWLHLTVVYCPITAILGLFLGWYGEALTFNCYFGKETWRVGVLVSGVPIGLVFLSMIINYGAIYAIVRKSLRSSEHVAGSKPVKKEATTLMIMYVVSTAVTTIPWFFMILFGKYYYYALLAATLVPLQGFFNFFIYMKPVFARFRAAHPNESKWFVLKQAILKSKAPPLQHRRVANNITHRSDVLITDVTLLANQAMNPSEELFYPGQLFSTTEFNNPQLDDPSNQPETNNNAIVEEQG